MNGVSSIRSNHEAKNSNPDKLNDFIIWRDVRKILNKELARLRRLKKMTPLSLEWNSNESYSHSKRLLGEYSFLVDWQKQFAMQVASKQTITASSLLERVMPYPVKPPSAWELLQSFDASKLAPEDQLVLKKMAPAPMEIMDFLQKKGCVKPENPFKEGESQNLEFKARVNGQGGIARDLVEAIVSMHNAKLLMGCSGTPRVICGISDDTFDAVGLEKEMVSIHPGFSLDKWIHIVLRNVAKTFTMSDEFERHLDFQFYTFQNHLILVLSLREGLDQLILTNPKRWTLAVRVGASVRRLQGYELIREITKNKKLNN